MLITTETYLATQDAARIAGYSKTWLRHLADSGRIRAVRCSGIRLYRRDDVERLARTTPQETR